MPRSDSRRPLSFVTECCSTADRLHAIDDIYLEEPELLVPPHRGQVVVMELVTDITNGAVHHLGGKSGGEGATGICRRQKRPHSPSLALCRGVFSLDRNLEDLDPGGTILGHHTEYPSGRDCLRHHRAHGRRDSPLAGYGREWWAILS